MDQDELVAGLRRRDAWAVGELLDSYGQRLLRSAFLLSGSEIDAQDLVQETFVQALDSIQRFRGKSSIYTWLHAILLNLARHHIRDSRRLVVNDELARKDVPVTDEGFARQDTETAGSALAIALRQVSEIHREVLVLRFYEEMRIHEIAAHLGLSKGTVKSRLHYAIAEMQRLLPEELNLFGANSTKEKEQR
ncbi:MAG TPA: RNA polymerase sigma factor [Verrucomicrobiae bacterium]|jgi:RNA polymerase sigma-70 factor (ECF subfamily)